MAGFTKDFWSKLSRMSIYSVEEGGMLSDQLEASTPGGANPSDAEPDAPEATNGTPDDGMNINIDGMGDDFSGDPAGGNETGEEGDSGMDTSTGDTSAEQPSNPNENPFKTKNGKGLLDNKLAELQAAVTDTLERIHANPRIDQVVVSELENLADSIRNIRETVYMVPIDATLYKYQLSTISYKQLSELVCASLRDI